VHPAATATVGPAARRFLSVLLASAHATKTALETLVIASFVRGPSVRDVEAALAEALGDQAAISKSMVSSICGQIKDEYQAWAHRPLGGITLDYLFLDASFSGCTLAPRPSRSWRPGASPPGSRPRSE
jgi:putative transposase